MTVPQGVPALIRAGTGTACPGPFHKPLQRASFGVQGALVAPLLDPLPFRLSRPTARFQLTGLGRSLALAKPEGQGLRPCTPARVRSPRRYRGGKLALISFRQYRAFKASRALSMTDQSIAAYHSGWRKQSCLECLARDTFYLCSPLNHGRFSQDYRFDRTARRSHSRHRRAAQETSERLRRQKYDDLVGFGKGTNAEPARFLCRHQTLASDQKHEAVDVIVFRRMDFLDCTQFSNSTIDQINIWAVAPDDGPAKLQFHAIPTFLSKSLTLFEAATRACRQGGRFRGFYPSWVFSCFPPTLMAKKPIPNKEAATEAAEGPAKVFRIDDVSASVFARERAVRGESRVFYSVSFSRSYKDANGAWRYSKSFDLEDLGKIISLCQQADEYIRGQLKEAA